MSELKMEVRIYYSPTGQFGPDVLSTESEVIEGVSHVLCSPDKKGSGILTLRISKGQEIIEREINAGTGYFTVWNI